MITESVEMYALKYNLLFLYAYSFIELEHGGLHLSSQAIAFLKLFVAA